MVEIGNPNSGFCRAQKQNDAVVLTEPRRDTTRYAFFWHLAMIGDSKEKWSALSSAPISGNHPVL